MIYFFIILSYEVIFNKFYLMNNIEIIKDLLGIYSTEPECEKDKYIHAFSFNKEILNNMININIPYEEKYIYSIEPVKMYLFDESLDKKIIYIEDNFEYNKILFPIYGFYDIKNNLCNKVLLSTNKINKYMENCGISSNSINIDTFYDESILNA